MAIYRVPTQNNQQYTLDAQLAAGGTSLTLNQSVAGIVRAPGVFVIDRIDSAGNKTASKREYISFTGVSGAQLTGLSRNLAGSTDQVHAVGAIVEFVNDVVQEDAWYTAWTAEHDASTYGHTDISASSASIYNLTTTTHFNVSGASLSGLPITPTWVLPGNTSSASVSFGKPLDMPKGGTIEWASVVLRSPASGCSLLFDINKNFVSIFEAGTRLSILGGGTYASTASLNTKAFNSGDVYSVDLDAGGQYADATVKFFAR